MYRNILLAILGASLASASAVPVQMADPKDVVITEYPSGLPSDLIPINGTEPADLETRSSGAGVYLCTERNFQGHCEHIWVPRGQCGMMPLSFADTLLLIDYGRAKLTSGQLLWMLTFSITSPPSDPTSRRIASSLRKSRLNSDKLQAQHANDHAM